MHISHNSCATSFSNFSIFGGRNSLPLFRVKELRFLKVEKYEHCVIYWIIKTALLKERNWHFGNANRCRGIKLTSNISFISVFFRKVKTSYKKLHLSLVLSAVLQCCSWTPNSCQLRGSEGTAGRPRWRVSPAAVANIRTLNPAQHYTNCK